VGSEADVCVTCAESNQTSSQNSLEDGLLPIPPGAKQLRSSEAVYVAKACDCVAKMVHFQSRSKLVLVGNKMNVTAWPKRNRHELKFSPMDVYPVLTQINRDNFHISLLLAR